MGAKRAGWCAAIALAIAGCQPGAVAPGEGVAVGAIATPEPTPAATASPVTAPMPTYDTPRVTPEEAKARMAAGDEIVIVDVRPASAYEREHIEGAVSAPWGELAEGHAQLPKDKLLLLYCT